MFARKESMKPVVTEKHAIKYLIQTNIYLSIL